MLSTLEQLHLLAHHCATDATRNIIGFTCAALVDFPVPHSGCTMLLRPPLPALDNLRRYRKSVEAGSGVERSGTGILTRSHQNDHILHSK